MRNVWLVATALCACAAGIGLWLGSRPALDEGAVILRYAERYTMNHAGKIEDCHGVPGRRQDVWIIVLCEGPDGKFAYPVGHDGRLVALTGEET